MTLRHLDPVDLLHRIRLGQNSLVGGLDGSQRHLPYYNCGFNHSGSRKGDLTRFSPRTTADLPHHVPRCILALCMAEPITGDRTDKKVMDDLVEHLFSLFDEADDLPGQPKDDTHERTIDLHSVREVTLALTELIRRGDERAEHWGRRMVRKLRQALDDNGKIDLRRLPSCLTRYTSQPHKEGRATGAMVSYYRVTGDEVALENALLMTDYALENCFSPHGALTERAGHHTHSINALTAGMLDLALLTNDPGLLERAKKVYDVGLPAFCSSFGWARERVDVLNEKGEGNTTADYLRGALLLGGAGFPEYFDLAERILRGHLLPSQLLDVKGYCDDPNAGEDFRRSLASRVLGGFGFRAPNDLIVPGYVNPYRGYETIAIEKKGLRLRSTKNAVLIKEADIVVPEDTDTVMTIYDVTSSVVEALCAAWHAVVVPDDLGIRINLLLSCRANGVSVTSHLSGEGRVDIDNSSGRNVLLRIPQWVPQSQVRLKTGGQERPPKFVGRYLLVPVEQADGTISVTFPERRQRTVESICFKEYTIDWVGDQIVAMSPLGPCLPMFPACE